MATVITSFNVPGSHDLNLMLCYYSNTSHQIQLLTGKNIPNWSFDRVVFPGQRLLFEAPPQAYLDVQTMDDLGTQQIQQIPCSQLWVNEVGNPFKDNCTSPTKELSLDV